VSDKPQTIYKNTCALWDKQSLTRISYLLETFQD
jgi:hypothetical protein